MLLSDAVIDMVLLSVCSMFDVVVNDLRGCICQISTDRVTGFVKGHSTANKNGIFPFSALRLETCPLR